MMKLTNEKTVPVNSGWGRWLEKVKGFFPGQTWLLNPKDAEDLWPEKEMEGF